LAKQHQAALSLLYVVPSVHAAGEYARFDYASFEAELRASGEQELATLVADEVRGRFRPRVWFAQARLPLKSLRPPNEFRYTSSSLQRMGAPD
jgi:hypothetical protein